MRDNQLLSVQSLTALRGLERLSLSGNSSLPSSEIQIGLEYNKGLTHIGLSDIPIPELGILPPLAMPFDYRLFELELDNTKPGNLWPPITRIGAYGSTSTGTEPSRSKRES